LPPEIVTLSWTLPYRVETALLVTVFEADEDDEEDDVDVEDELELDVEGAAVVTAAAVGAFECGVKPSVAPRPAAVAARTMGARFMVGSGS
jgi:hypothetical protein